MSRGAHLSEPLEHWHRHLALHPDLAGLQLKLQVGKTVVLGLFMGTKREKRSVTMEIAYYIARGVRGQ